MSSTVKVSIVIPVYNVEQYLHDCILCLKKQTYTNFEAIFVNDGSSDNSGEILESAAKEDARFLVIHKDNGGAAEARNYGLDRCSGEYICFIDADDLVERDYLEILLDVALQHKCDIVQCGYQRTESRDIIINDSKSKEDRRDEVLSNLQMLDKIYSAESVDTIVLWNKIYKRELFDNVRFPQGIMFEDEVVSAKILYKAEKIVRIDTILYYYFYNEQSVMNKKYSLRKLDILTALQLRMDFYYGNGLIELYQKDGYKYLYKILQNYYFIHQNIKDNRNIKRNIMKRYWKKYREAVRFSWSKKRKIAMLFFGVFPLSYSWIRKF